MQQRKKFAKIPSKIVRLKNQQVIKKYKIKGNFIKVIGNQLKRKQKMYSMYFQSKMRSFSSQTENFVSFLKISLGRYRCQLEEQVPIICQKLGYYHSCSYAPKNHAFASVLQFVVKYLQWPQKFAPKHFQNEQKKAFFKVILGNLDLPKVQDIYIK